jgi:GNAT superfamily N-acetyltransferase
VFEKYWELISPDTDKSVVLLDNGLRLSEHEGQLAYYYGKLDQVRAVEYRNKIIGFLIYQIVLDGILLIRGLYVLPEYAGFGLGKGLVNSLTQPISKVIFQTRLEVPPNRLLGHVASRATKICETSQMATWEMTWEKSNEFSQKNS